MGANSCDDLGLGKGVVLTISKLDNITDTGSIMEPRGISDKWGIRIPYVCKMDDNGGLGEI